MNVHSIIIHSSQKYKWSKCSLTDEWIIKMWYNHKMKYYSTMQINYIIKNIKWNDACFIYEWILKTLC